MSKTDEYKSDFERGYDRGQKDCREYYEERIAKVNEKLDNVLKMIDKIRQKLI